MIRSLVGKIIEIEFKDSGAAFVELEVGGVGYGIWVSRFASMNLNVGMETNFKIYSHIRESEFTLFGFINFTERGVFESLISVTGVGPRLAMGILSETTAEKIVHMISERNVNELKKLPGIGKKTAERISIELSENILKNFPHIGKINTNKTGACSSAQASDAAHVNAGLRKEAIEALRSLGFKQQKAESAVDEVLLSENASPTDLSDLVRKSLNELSHSVL